MTTPRATRLKFWLRPPVKSSLREAFPAEWRLPATTLTVVPSSSSTASLMAWNVCWTSGSDIGLSSRSEMTAIARADCPVFRSLLDRLARRNEVTNPNAPSWGFGKLCLCKCLYVGDR